MREKLVDLRLAHFCGMTFVVEEDKPANPADVGFFGAQTVVAGTNGRAHTIQQLGWLRFVGCSDVRLTVCSGLSHKRQCCGGKDWESLASPKGNVNQAVASGEGRVS